MNFRVWISRAECIPRGAYAPRSWLHDVRSLRKTTFGVHKRTSTRAASVSPPWFGRHLYADTRAIARKTADSMWADHRCHRVQRYHGGLTPPALDARAGGVSAVAHAVRGLFDRGWFLFASGFRLLLALFGSQPGLTCISHQCSSGCCLRCSEGEAGTSPACGSLCSPMPCPTDTRSLERGSWLRSSAPGWMDKGDSSELGRQVPPSHVGTPSLGNTQICKINHSPMMAAKMSSSIADSLIGRMVSHRLPGRLGLP
jgi:hypothetical protein